MPTILLEKCIKCNKCVADCPSNAIDLSDGSISSNCIHCGHCVAICPEEAVMPDNGEVTPLQKLSFTHLDFEAFTAGMRTCRNYKKKAVDKKQLEALLENVKNYSSASNARPVGITVVQSANKLNLIEEKTADVLIKKLTQYTSPLMSPIIKMLMPGFDLNGLKRYKNGFIIKRKKGEKQVCYEAPVVLLFHGPKSKIGMADSDALIWATSISMHANAMGLGTCFNGFIVKAMESDKNFRSQFNIPQKNKVYCTLLLGHPNVKYKNEVSRKRPEVNYV